MHWDLTKMYSGFDDAKLAADFAQAQALNQELAALLQEKPADVGAGGGIHFSQFGDQREKRAGTRLDG